MESTLGIICEYNPFHMGHSFQIAASELLLGEHAPVVCVMSGDFVQRGEPAIFPKHLRAAEAVKHGADLVVELPLPWCLSSAESFAFGGVSILASMGVTHLSFGSESGDIEELKKAANAMDDAFQEELKDYIRNHPEQSYASAVSNVSGSALLLGPNNLLGIEYIRAIKKIRPSMNPITVKRYTQHDGRDSAKEIREKVFSGELSLKNFGEPVDRKKLETAIVSRLRMFDAEYYNSLPEAANGLGNRFYKAVRSAATLEEIYEAAKTKRFSHSAIRRLAMCAACGVKSGMNEQKPPYVRVLAFNKKGRDFLSYCRKNSEIPIITQPKEVLDLNDFSKQVFAVGASAKDLYELGFPSNEPLKCGNDYRMGPIIV